MALFKIVVWAIVFLTKLRFPPGKLIAAVLKLYLNYKVEYKVINIPHIHSNFLLLIEIAPNNAFDSMFHQQTLHIDNLQKHITFDLCTLAPTQ